MISWKLKRWRLLGAAAVLSVAACGQPAATSDDDDGLTPNATAPVADESGEGGEGGEGGTESGDDSGGERGESGENSGPG